MNLDGTTAPFRASVWLRKTEDGRPYLSGATSFPIPGKTEAEMQDVTPTPDDMPRTVRRARKGKDEQFAPRPPSGRG